MSSNPQHDNLERVKAEIRADADRARLRNPLPRADVRSPSEQAPAQRPGFGAVIQRERLDYATGELTGAHYHAFLDGAFRALLKRPPDEAGAESQMRLLVAGASKAEILGNLRWSLEGKRIGTRVRGLLPRYALAKLTRLPVLGYAVAWGIELAGLPILLRHQRAADTAAAARFTALTDAQQGHDRHLEELRSSVTAHSARHDQRLEAIGDDIRRALLRLDRVEQRAHALEDRTTTLEQGNATNARELAGLRHHVHTANHWVASLQHSLTAIEEAAKVRRRHADRLAAARNETPADAATRSARHAGWAMQLATRLPAASAVLDLGSGDGAWLDALGARGVVGRGIEANSVLVVRAQARGANIALGDPLDALARCAESSLGGLVIAAHAFPASDIDIADLLAQAQCALKPQGYLLLRLEQSAPRVVGTASALLDATLWAALLRGAGFDSVSELAATGATALIARRP